MAQRSDAQALHEEWVVDQPAQAGSPVSRLVGVDEQAADAVLDDGREATDRGRDDGRAGRLGLDGDQAEGLVVGRHRDGGGRGRPDRQLQLRHRRHEADHVGDAELVGQLGERLGVLEARTRRTTHDGYDESVPQRRVLVEQHADRLQQHVGRLERLDPAGEEQHDRVLGEAELASSVGPVAGAEDTEVDAGVDHVDGLGAGTVEVDQLAGLGVGVGDEEVRGLDDLLLADHACHRLRGVPLGHRLVLDLRHGVHRVHQRHVPAVAREGADLAGEPVVGVHGVVVAERVDRLGAQHLARERAELSGQLTLGQALERTGGDVADQHAVRRLDHLRERRARGPGEDVDRDALLGQPSGELDDVDVHPARIARAGLVEG